MLPVIFSVGFFLGRRYKDDVIGFYLCQWYIKNIVFFVYFKKYSGMRFLTL